MTATPQTLINIIRARRSFKNGEFDAAGAARACVAYNALRGKLSGPEKSMLEFGDDMLGVRARPLSLRKRLEWLERRLERRGTLRRPVSVKHLSRFGVWSREVERGLSYGDLLRHMRRQRQRFGVQGEGMIWANNK